MLTFIVTAISQELRARRMPESSLIFKALAGLSPSEIVDIHARTRLRHVLISLRRILPYVEYYHEKHILSAPLKYTVVFCFEYIYL
jgi:hypothetical protein